MTTRTDFLTTARAAKALRLVCYLDTAAQARSVDLSSPTACGLMADRLRVAPASYWAELTAAAHERMPSRETQREVIREYERRCVLGELYASERGAA